MRVVIDSIAETDVDGEASTGEDAIARDAEVSPRIKVLVLTMDGDDESVFAALRAGACRNLLRVRTRPTFCGRSAPSRKAR
jgi:DNA-binding NarL/FixJ family response regulator